MQDTIQDILTSLPHTSGIYQFFNAKNEIIYVGKSKNLKSRVSSYFNGKKSLNFAKKKMVGQIRNIQYILTNNETESLILENDLIKSYQPKYNVLLKDDKNFLYLKITQEIFPKVIKTRIAPSEIKKRDGQYFGPYISWYQVTLLLKLLKSIFGYGVWNHHFFRYGQGYNLDKYIFEGNIDATEWQIYARYSEQIEKIKKFLSGDTSSIKQELQEKMLKYAQNLEFEKAEELRQTLAAIASLDTMQIVRDGVKGNYFVVQILDKYDRLNIGTIKIIEGKIVSYENFEVQNDLSESVEDVLSLAVEKLWAENQDIPKLKFLVPRELPELSPVIFYEVPELGSKYELLKLCYTNLYEFAHKQYMKSLSSRSFSKQTMQNLLDILGYEKKNAEILFECNDISHLSGNHTVASRSVIENGKKATNKYRKYRIKSLQEGDIDDFASMREVFSRRLTELIKLWNLPDLVIIDGGKWQLSAVMEILSHFQIHLEEITSHIALPEDRNFEQIQCDLQHLQIVSLAKREEELFLPGVSESILLERDSNELRLVQAIRDEAHRFAISFNRDSRSKNQKTNILESLPGIGPKNRKKILTLYGSVKELKNISYSDAESQLWKKIAEVLEDHGLLSGK